MAKSFHLSLDELISRASEGCTVIGVRGQNVPIETLNDWKEKLGELHFLVTRIADIEKSTLTYTIKQAI